MTPTIEQSANHLLKTLGPEVDLLASHLDEVRLRQGEVLQEQETRVERIYFPLSGVVSLLSIMQNGALVETATIGREGTLGAFAGLGPWHAFSRAAVQIPGNALAIAVAPFQNAVSRSERLRNLILRYKEALLAQIQQTAACNALHLLEPRLARWLLQILDRAGGSDLPLTQDAIAAILGVRRSTVTGVAGKLQDKGLIRYHRGKIVVLDRTSLERTACECYLTIRRRTEAAFNGRDTDCTGPDKVPP